jgi:hypothetical protein
MGHYSKSREHRAKGLPAGGQGGQGRRASHAERVGMKKDCQRQWLIPASGKLSS